MNWNSDTGKERKVAENDQGGQKDASTFGSPRLQRQATVEREDHREEATRLGAVEQGFSKRFPVMSPKAR